MRLKVDEVSARALAALAALRLRRAEEVIETDFEQIRRRRIAGDMSAQFAIGAIRAHDHRQCVPAQRGREPGFDLEIARVRRLRGNRDRIHVGRDA